MESPVGLIATVPATCGLPVLSGLPSPGQRVGETDAGATGAMCALSAPWVSGIARVGRVLVRGVHFHDIAA